ncbi:MAG TPA: DUF2341 domain-containing protein [Kofleriaceae bacterium]|nr:DUF2341 domain-containing protein [Kofleriaceae bacterium]
MRGVLLACLAGACGCNGVFGLEPTELVSINPRTILFDNRASKSDLVDFPVPIRIDPTRVVYQDIVDPRTDLRFHDPRTDADLPFEIERWVPDGESIVWVKVPRITAGSSTDSIAMHYGAEAHGTEAPGDVWTEFGLVVHGKAGTYQSAAGPIVGTATGVMATDGPIGSAMKFGGTGEHRIAFSNSRPLIGGATQFTMELWLYADYENATAMGGEPRIIEQYNPLMGGRLFKWNGVEPVAAFQVDINLTTATNYTPTLVPFRKWTQLTFTFDGQLLWIYRNGALADIGLDGTGPMLAAATEDLDLGDVSRALEGMLDEVRLCRFYRTDDWVQAQYLAMTGGFISFATPGSR